MSAGRLFHVVGAAYVFYVVLDLISDIETSPNIRLIFATAKDGDVQYVCDHLLHRERDAATSREL